MFQENLNALMQKFPVEGKLVWIGTRPIRKQAMVSVDEVFVDSAHGLLDDHYAGRSKKRQITLFQWEHFSVIEAFTGIKIIPEMLRRNLVVRGINIIALKKQEFRIGNAVFKTTGLCHPCSRMETILGVGGYNAMRNHGGITAQVLQSGQIKKGDTLSVLNLHS